MTDSYLDKIPEALKVFQDVMIEAEPKHGKDTWQKVSIEEHIRHAYKHIKLYENLKRQEDLQHAFVRLALAVELDSR